MGGKPAKTSPPATVATVRRERLFGKLDELRDRRALWVSGPAGAGKTTLVSDWTADRELPSLWYRVDEADEDPQASLALLGALTDEGGERLRVPALELPRAGPAGIASAARAWFRNFHSGCASGTVLVFDDAAGAPLAKGFADLLLAALSETPAGNLTVVLSRENPPAQFARMQANRALARLGWPDLRLTDDEAVELGTARMKGRLPPDELLAVHARSGGWIVGYLLLLDRSASGTALSRIDVGAPETLDAYLDTEVLGGLAERERKAIVRLAHLPTVTAEGVTAVTDEPEPQSTLALLTRRNVLVERLAAPSPTYRLHPLLRDFLQSRAKELLSAQEHEELLRKSARFMETSGDLEGAIDLQARLEAWPELAALMKPAAPGLLERGRFRLLERVMELLPAEQVSHDGWLLHWKAACEAHHDPHAARETYAKAFQAHLDGGDLRGAALAWAAAMATTTLQWGDEKAVDALLNRFEETQQICRGFPPEEAEVAVLPALSMACMLRRPEHPELPRWIERVEELLVAASSPSEQVQLAAAIFHHCGWWGDLPRAERVLSWLDHSVAEQPIDAVTRATLRMYRTVVHWLQSRLDESLEEAARGLDELRRDGVHALRLRLALQARTAALCRGDLPLSARYGSEATAALQGADLGDIAHFEWVASWDALLRGEIARARSHSAKCESSIAQTQWVLPRAMNALTNAHVLVEQGESDAALEAASRGIEPMERAGAEVLLASAYLTRAHVHLSAGRPGSGRDDLERAFALHRRHGLFNGAWWRPSVVSRACVEALEAGIEVEHVRELVRRRGLVPEHPPLHVDAWPWALRVRMLGPFELERHDQVLRFSGRGRPKALELLQALVAHGGQRVSAQRLQEELWPEVDGVRARRSFDTTLHRLRRHLDLDGVLVVREGCLDLDERLVWVDAHALSACLATLEHGLGSSISADQLLPEVERATSLWRGPFLPDAEGSWAHGPREQLRARFVATLQAVAEELEDAGLSEQALACHEKCVEVDDLAEQPQAQLMRLLALMGRRVDAIAAYERYRTRLLRQLDIGPSPQLAQLARALRAEGRTGSERSADGC